MKKILSIILAISFILCLTSCGEKAPTWEEQFDLGVKYMNDGNYEEAIIAFTSSIEIEEKTESYFTRGVLYVRLDGEENLKKAEADFKKAISLDKKNKHAYQNLYFLLARQDRIDEARDILDDARKELGEDEKLEIPSQLLRDPQESEVFVPMEESEIEAVEKYLKDVSTRLDIPPFEKIEDLDPQWIIARYIHNIYTNSEPGSPGSEFTKLEDIISEARKQVNPDVDIKDDFNFANSPELKRFTWDEEKKGYYWSAGFAGSLEMQYDFLDASKKGDIISCTVREAGTFFDHFDPSYSEKIIFYINGTNVAEADIGPAPTYDPVNITYYIFPDKWPIYNYTLKDNGDGTYHLISKVVLKEADF